MEREKRKGRNEKEKGRKEREKYMGRGGGAARQAKGKSLNPARVSEADTKKRRNHKGIQRGEETNGKQKEVGGTLRDLVGESPATGWRSVRAEGFF